MVLSLSGILSETSLDKSRILLGNRHGTVPLPSSSFPQNSLLHRPEPLSPRHKKVQINKNLSFALRRDTSLHGSPERCRDYRCRGTGCPVA
jgi:hypothetical protein